MKSNEAYMTKVHKTLEILAWCLAAASFALAMYGNITLPDEIAIHFGWDGTADGYGSPKILFLTPVITVILLLIVFVSTHMVKPENWNVPFELTETNRHRVYRVLLNMMFALELEMAAFFFYLCVEQFLQCGSRIFPVMCVWMPVLFLTIIFFYIRAKRINYDFKK